MVSIRFTRHDYNKLINDSPEYPFYSKGGGNGWKIYDDKTEKRVGSWNAKTERLQITNPKLRTWLKQNSY